MTMNTINTKIIAGVVVLGALLAPIAAQAAPNFANKPINARLHHAQKRIDNGVRTGRLTPLQAAKLERREARIRNQEAAFRQANGGKLTLAERTRLDKETKHLSRAIHRQTHPGVNA